VVKVVLGPFQALALCAPPFEPEPHNPPTHPPPAAAPPTHPPTPHPPKRRPHPPLRAQQRRVLRHQLRQRRARARAAAAVRRHPQHDALLDHRLQRVDGDRPLGPRRLNRLGPVEDGLVDAAGAHVAEGGGVVHAGLGEARGEGVAEGGPLVGAWWVDGVCVCVCVCVCVWVGKVVG